MEASKLSCTGSPHHALCPPTRGISRGGSRGIKAAQAVKCYGSPQASLSCGRPSSKLSLLPVVGALSNLASGPSAWAAEEALSSTEAASTQVFERAGAAVEGAGVAASQVVQSSADGAGATASSTVDSVADSASQAVQSSVERVGNAASKIGNAASKVGNAASKTAATAGNSDMVINILGTGAFIGLALLTVAVLYLFITDFLEKRKRDEEMKKLNEEEAAARKKKGGSLTAASKGGAKGFGRKRPVDDDQ